MMSHKTKQIIITILSLAILVLLAMFLFAKDNQDNLEEPSSSFTLTEEQQQEVINSIINTEPGPSLTQDQQDEMIANIMNTDPGPSLTEEEQQNFLDSMNLPQ
jgi:YbbR domain-containing protein